MFSPANSSSLLTSGRKTDSAVTDKTIAMPTGVQQFSYIDIFNEGTTELTIAIDEDSTAATKPIYIPAGTGMADYIQGGVIHYSGAAGTTNFRFRIRS